MMNTFEDLDLIVDPNLRAYFKKEITRRMKDEGLSFEKAMQKDIWAFDKKKDRHGKPLLPIRHIRTLIKGGGGFVTYPATIRNTEAYKSESACVAALMKLYKEKTQG